MTAAEPGTLDQSGGYGPSNDPKFEGPVIVTGASGWLGRPLVAALVAEGHLVRCLVPDDASHPAGVEVVVGDVRDPTTLERLFEGLTEPTVFHLAGVIHPPGRTRLFFDVNVGGTALLVDEARRAGAQRLVHMSSNSPFGFSRSPQHVFDENSPYHPHAGYGASKMEAERIVFRAHERGLLETVVVRAPWFYGPYQPARQTQFFTAVRKGLFPQCGDGTNRRSMAYVDNLVQGLLLAGSVPAAAGNAYWIADERPYEMSEILAAVKRACEMNGLEVKRRQLKVPGVLSEIAGLADRALQATGIYVQPVHVLSEMNKTIACTVDKAKDELGYRPAVALEEGMRRSVEWCLKEGLEL